MEKKMKTKMSGKRQGPGRGLDALIEDGRGSAADESQANSASGPAGTEGFEDKAAVLLHRLTKRSFVETVGDVGQAIAALDELRAVLLAAAREHIGAEIRMQEAARRQREEQLAALESR
jgi:hypothetical protein